MKLPRNQIIFMNDIASLLKTSGQSSAPTLLKQKKTSAAFQKKITEMEIAQKEKMAAVQATILGLPYINLEKIPINPETLKLANQQIVEKLHAIPFYSSTTELKVGAIRPGTPEVLKFVEDLEKKYHVKSQLHLISERSFSIAYKQYENLPKLKENIKGVQITEDDLQQYQQEIKVLTDLQKIIAGVSTSDVVTAMVALGLQARASDIHIESEEDDVKIRYRIDGVLQDAAGLPHDTFPRISNRLKLLSHLKLNIVNQPQDGRFTIFLKDDKIDVRVSILPTTFGESIVMRLLRASSTGISFDDLGIQGTAYNRLKQEISKPNGMIITTGPTGSGKTTTLYSILLELNSSETKIITLEDPVEYKLEGINQSQVDIKKGYDFANGLRSILRQDPDIIMVGEIRDFDTADTAINAALTGHLVISTLHTNSASGAIPRFISMGVKGFLLSPALNAVIGQRLVRRICPDCVIDDQLDEKNTAKLDEIIGQIPKEDLGEYNGKKTKEIAFKKGAGCQACQGLGYKGRIGIYEIMSMTKEMEKLILSEQVSEYKIQELAMRQGMITMVQDGILKAMQGLTTISEVFRVAKSLE